jgi:hypothetical protein
MGTIRELAHINVEFFEKGSAIRGTHLTEYYMKWNRNGAKMFLVPAGSTRDLMRRVAADRVEVIKNFASIRIQAIGDTDTGLTSGLMDDIISRYSAIEIVGPHAQSLIEYATINTRQDGARWSYAWIGVFDVDPDTDQVLYMGAVDMNSIMMKIGA